MKLQTKVDIKESQRKLSYEDSFISLGSCFSDNIANKMSRAGFDICQNPFGTLYNPQSIANSISLLSSDFQFTEKDCIQMGAGADLISSFYHHSSFARKTKEQFLENANSKLLASRTAWQKANIVIITFGTAWVYTHKDLGICVSNCLKRIDSEFVRNRLSVEQIEALYSEIISANKDKHFIFSLSPIRHWKDGAVENNLSKSILNIAIHNLCEKYPNQCQYFPSYEIVMDELRDYRFYAEDMLHPSNQSIDYIWDCFKDFAFTTQNLEKIRLKEKEYQRSQHRSILNT